MTERRVGDTQKKDTLFSAGPKKIRSLKKMAGRRDDIDIALSPSCFFRIFFFFIQSFFHLLWYSFYLLMYMIMIDRCMFMLIWTGLSRQNFE